MVRNEFTKILSSGKAPDACQKVLYVNLALYIVKISPKKYTLSVSNCMFVFGIFNVTKTSPTYHWEMRNQEILERELTTCLNLLMMKS